MNRQEKSRIISELQDKFVKASGVIFTDYKGLTVEEISDLRRQLREESLEYRVVKNTLARRASEDTPVSAAKDVMSGPVGLAISYEDPTRLAKKILGYSKSNEKLKVTGGIIEGKSVAFEEIKVISELPSKEILLSMLIGAMQSPLSKLASGLNAVPARIVYALAALKERKESSA